MSVPTNKTLYEKVKKEAKRKFKVWPSIYASSWVVKTYKKRGGKYKKSKSNNSLDRWFREKWIDVCKLPKKVSCGRKKASPKNYPYCRPSIRVSPKTPRTIKEISRAELKRRCSRKRRKPYSRLKNKNYSLSFPNISFIFVSISLCSQTQSS